MFELTNNIISSLDQNKKALALFFYLQKAFDVVSHENLPRELNTIDIRGLALKWFQSYSTEITQKVE